MKKMMAWMLTLAMAMSLAACGGSGSSSSASTEPASTEAATTAAEATTGAADEETTAAAEETTAAGSEAASTDSDMAYVKDKGTLVVGITDFQPMDYKDENGAWIGFDADMATAFAERLGVEVQFLEIDWDYKTTELDGKTIDCVWNGMTLVDEVTSAMACSKPYCSNAQVVVVPADKAADYQTVESLTDLSFAAEAGSAGEKALAAKNLNCTPVQSQANALMEVKSGTADAAVIDLLMAAAMVGEGTDYADLASTVTLNEDEGEVYGVGFRKGSDLVDELNAFFAESYADGSMQSCAENYGIGGAILEQ